MRFVTEKIPRRTRHSLLVSIILSTVVASAALNIVWPATSVTSSAAVQIAATVEVAPSWSITSSLNTARNAHTATLLQNGKVLVAGGSSGNRALVNSAELYDPDTGEWSYTGNLNTARAAHTATLLPNGKVLVAGGYNYNGDSPTPLNGAEFYDPATGTWTKTGNLSARLEHTATLLANGNVLVVGGWCDIGCARDDAELYDPATGKWTATGSLNSPDQYFPGRVAHFATLLPDGRVLVLGGADPYDCLDSTELYNPATGKWSSTGKLNICRYGRTAPLLSNGKVLVAGSGSAELYDPVAATWSLTGSLHSAGFWSLETLLSDGRVLVTGGTVGGPAGNRPALNNAELYDPATASWTVTASLNVAREDHTATLLGDGKVLVTGGVNSGISGANPLSSAELYVNAAIRTATSVSAASYQGGRLAADSIVAVFGTQLATSSAHASLPLPNSLAGTQVSVRDASGAISLAPLFFVSPTQVNFKMPAAVAAGPAEVLIVSGDGTVSSSPIEVTAVAPGLFSANGDGAETAAGYITLIRGGVAAGTVDIAQFDSQRGRYIARPINMSGTNDEMVLTFFGTGFRHFSSLSAVTVLIGGANQQVEFAGPQGTFVGLDQINVRLSRSLAGRGVVQIVVTVDGATANVLTVEIS